MKRFNSKVVHVLPIIFSFLLVGNGDQGDNAEEEKNDSDDSDDSPSESDEGVASSPEITWSTCNLEEDDTSEPLVHEIGEDVSHEDSDPSDDGPLEDENNSVVAGKHVIMFYDITEGNAGTFEVTPEDDEEWNRQAQHDADTDANPRHMPTSEDEDE